MLHIFFIVKEYTVLYPYLIVHKVHIAAIFFMYLWLSKLSSGYISSNCKQHVITKHTINTHIMIHILYHIKSYISPQLISAHGPLAPWLILMSQAYKRCDMEKGSYYSLYIVQSECIGCSSYNTAWSTYCFTDRPGSRDSSGLCRCAGGGEGRLCQVQGHW